MCFSMIVLLSCSPIFVLTTGMLFIFLFILYFLFLFCQFCSNTMCYWLFARFFLPFFYCSSILAILSLRILKIFVTAQSPISFSYQLKLRTWISAYAPWKFNNNWQKNSIKPSGFGIIELFRNNHISKNFLRDSMFPQLWKPQMPTKRKTFL